MSTGLPDLGERLGDVRARIAAAARRAGRDPSRVLLVGVVKTLPLDVVRQAIERGLTDLGENLVQEAAAAVTAVGRHAARWHMIGHLQRNKVNRALELFDRMHGLDGMAIAEAVSCRAVERGFVIPALVQVNVSGETGKWGARPDEVARLVERIAGLPGVALDGLMTIGAPVASGEQARGTFARLRELRDAAERVTGVGLPELSMGMSGDFEVAVEEGSTMVRVGTALFGPRAV